MTIGEDFHLAAGVSEDEPARQSLHLTYPLRSKWHITKLLVYIYFRVIAILTDTSDFHLADRCKLIGIYRQGICNVLFVK